MPTATKKSTSKLLSHPSSPPMPMEGEIADRRSQFRKLTNSAPPQRGAERAFLASKLAMLRSHPDIAENARTEAEALLMKALGPKAAQAMATKAPPIPGGVGYGMFYTAAYRALFARGTSLYYEIVCPYQPSGNVNTFLYLTATNRAQKGVEAFVSYQGQNDTRFKVFDWARTDQWQTNIKLANLSAYLHSSVSHTFGFQTLPVWNSTFEIAPNRWRNEVLLHNRAANRWDLVYRYDYASTTAEQHAGWSGSWGPIVETFQNPYKNTRWLGFINTMLMGRNAAGQWGSSVLLVPSQSSIRNDGVGFSPLFLDPNYTFVVKS